VKRYVFDSYALLAFLEDGPGAAQVEKALREVMGGKAEGWLSIINWGEIYYTAMREQGEKTAEKVVALLAQYPMRLVEADQPLTREAARFKARFRIAYADCFAAALAKRHKATVLTGDPEFRQVEKEVKVLWLA
jgi:ribonuclease VapC